jgi:hypothetical protein
LETNKESIVNRNVWIDRGRQINNYTPRVPTRLTKDHSGKLVERYQSSGGGSAVSLASCGDGPGEGYTLNNWARKRRRARQTHPGKRGKQP